MDLVDNELYISPAIKRGRVAAMEYAFFFLLYTLYCATETNNKVLNNKEEQCNLVTKKV